MDGLLENAYHYYNILNDELGDSRTKNYFLMNKTFLIFIIIIGYIYFVLKLGPSLMENRKPFQLKTTMIIYNILQIVFNCFIFIENFRYKYGWNGTNSYICEPIDFSDSPMTIYTTRIIHLYFLLKLADLLDTVFMVLRKKNDHITFLHVYHHTMILFISWSTAKYLPGGHGSFIPFVNSFIHAIMYTYYLLAAISPPECRRLLWWKKYLTQLQIIQFVAGGIHFMLPVFFPCGYPTWTAWIICPQALFLIILFYNFYKEAYQKINKTKTN